MWGRLVLRHTSGVVPTKGAALAARSSRPCVASRGSRPACTAATMVWMVYPGIATLASICQTSVSIVRSAASSLVNLQKQSTDIVTTLQLMASATGLYASVVDQPF